MAKIFPKYKKIRQYVIGIAVKADGEPKKLMPERELSELFGVNRMTVRKALKQLHDEGIIYSRPSVGTFINPEKSNNMERYAGIIYGNGRTVNYGEKISEMLGSSLYLLGRRKILCRFLELSYNGRQAAKEIAAYNLDGILWFFPRNENFETIECLRKMDIPVVIAGSGCVDRFEADPGNRVIYDARSNAEELAEFFVKHGHRKILFISAIVPGYSIKRDYRKISYLSDSIIRFKIFTKKIKSLAPECKTFFIDDEKDIRQRIFQVAEKNRITALFSIGEEKRLNAIYDFLQNNSNIDFVLDYGNDNSLRFADLCCNGNKGYFCDNMITEITTVAVEKLVKTLTDKKWFDSIYIKQRIIPISEKIKEKNKFEKEVDNILKKFKNC